VVVDDLHEVVAALGSARASSSPDPARTAEADTATTSSADTTTTGTPDTTSTETAEAQP
jgi:hypothetical protein